MRELAEEHRQLASTRRAGLAAHAAAVNLIAETRRSVVTERRMRRERALKALGFAGDDPLENGVLEKVLATARGAALARRRSLLAATGRLKLDGDHEERPRTSLNLKA